MHHRLIVASALALSLAAAAPALAAGSESEYKAALAAAEKAEQEAGALRNQWTTTAQAIKAAQKEAAAGNFDKAAALARHAEALANASIAQSKEQATAWRRADIR